MSKKFSIIVKGKKKHWSFIFYDNPEYLQDWIDDGLQINELINIVPDWVVSLGLAKPWVFLQDLFNFNLGKE